MPINCLYCKDDSLAPSPVPGEALDLFSPGIVSDGLHNRDIAITPDGNEIYTTVSLGNNGYSRIVAHKMENGIWQDARTATFSSGFKFHDIKPVISSDGKRIFFCLYPSRPR